MNHSFDTLRRIASETRAHTAFVLGSGTSAVAADLEPLCSVPFSAIPGFYAATVPGHRGELLLGTWAEQTVLVFAGRLHYYEGHSWDAVVQPVRLAHALGASVLLLTNAAGGIADELTPGSFMIVRDQIEWTRPHCWREPPQPSPYAPRLCALLQQAGRDLGWELASGVYASVTGPCYETPAEIRALRHCGADAVGMSTAREIRLGCELGMECAALSCITNRAAGLSAAPLDHREVLATAATQSERLRQLLTQFLRRVRSCALR